MGILSDILAVKPRTRLSTAVQKAPVQQYVNAEHLVPIGITVPLERPTPFVDARPVVTKRLSAKDQFLLIDAFLSKHPHYKFVKKTKSGWTSEVKYWFRNCKTNTLIVATYEEIGRELSCSVESSIRSKQTGIVPQEVAIIDPPPGITFDDFSIISLRRLQYTLYKIKKYGDENPFDTDFWKFDRKCPDQRFDYSDRGCAPV